MRRILTSIFPISAAALLLTAPVAAQTGTLTGTVVDEETGAPLADAAVEVLGAEEEQAGGVFSDQQGRFRISLPPGAYAVVFSNLGYETERIDRVQVQGGETTEVTIELASRALQLNPVVVTASRREEKALDAPAAVSIVPEEQLQRNVGLSPVEHVKGLQGVDIAQTGLNQSNVVTRGFNNVFSGSLLVLTDNRYAHVPSLRFNAHNMIPVTSSDVERIEIVLGPGAALYGPNSASGVMHIITTSPIDDPGTTVSVASGLRAKNELEQSAGLDAGGVYQGQFRAASRIGDDVGVKFSGQWFRGDDWAFRDEIEEQAAEQAPPGSLIGQRQDRSERWGGEARLDWRPWRDGEVIFNAGVNRLVSSVELTGQGAGQADDWTYSYVQSRLRKGRFFAQAFVNMSDAGDTYLLRNGSPIVDKSRMWVGQVQHGFDLGDSQTFTYGLDLQRTEPRTEGTITGSNEDDDIIDEVGGYLHSETALADQLDLVAALRVDWHNRLPDVNVSPRIALAYRPEEDQNFRVTFNRAFSAPTTNNLFLDIEAARIPFPSSQNRLYDVVLTSSGVPETGFTFDEPCQGGIQNLCMYALLPGAPDQAIPANGALLWDGLIQQLAPQLGLPAPLSAAIVQLLSSPAPGALGSELRTFDQVAAQSGEYPWPRTSPGPEPIDRITSTITNTFELGYKGLIGDRLLLSANVYRSQVEDFVGPLRVETPNVFLSGSDAVAYIQQRLQPLVVAGQLSAEQAAGLAQQLGGQIGQIPLGTVQPDQRSGSDLMLTYRNFGDVDFYGVDLGAQVLATDRLSLRGTFSWVSEECFDFNGDGDCTSAVDISLNAPTVKGSAGILWEDKALGLGFGGQVRYTDDFVMNSGVYVGEVDSYTVVDANASYSFSSLTGLSATLSVNNVFNDLHQEFVGAPYIGRLAMLRLQYEL